MNRCLIIGGGLAGLSAAAILSSKNFNVTLIESSPKLGGRVYSFFDKESNSDIDNGQHIMMGCYKETLSFLKLIGAENNFDYQKNLYLKFLDRNKNAFQISASKLFYPFNLLKAILDYNRFSLKQKIYFIIFLLKLPLLSKNSLTRVTIKEWLEKENQDLNTIKSFWEILGIGALNTSLEKASAVVFYEVLIQIFYKGNFASTIILPKYGLSESIINPAASFLKNNNGKIILSETIKEVQVKNRKIVTVKSDKNIYDDFDCVISAIPLYALEKIISKRQLNIDLELEYSTILNIHIWLKEISLMDKFYGLLDSPLHWIFVKQKHINIVISNAGYLENRDKDEIYNLVCDELARYTSIIKDDIIKYQIIKEKRATFVPDINSLSKRPNSKTEIKNLFLAGDWINTGLPSTIESAVKSGRLAAELVLKEFI
ncbi:MAG: hydroxysqualene dehydroxylase HpnE [Ignavibacterium sp.]|jgi:squalene-associated FAD-dependent desaturase|nr:hydroxysqualene dehydroxylase HpnE [Ignavibacterium sp.]